MKRVLISLFFLGLINCQDQLEYEELEFSENAQVFFTNKEINDKFSIMVRYSNGTSYNFAEQVSKMAVLDKTMNDKLLLKINEFKPCFMGKHTFIRMARTYESNNGILLRIIDNDLESYWTIGRRSNNHNEFAIRQLTFERKGDAYEYNHFGCFKSNNFEEEYTFMFDANHQMISLAVPVHSEHNIDYSIQSGYINWIHVAIILIGFIGGYISVLIIMSLFKRTREMSFGTKNSIGIAYGVFIAVLAIILMK